MYPSIPRSTLFSLALLYCSFEQAHADIDPPLEIVEVTAPSIEVSVGGNIDAETFYDAEQVQALGVSTLEELMEELAPDVASVRGRQSGKPIILVNGRRIASFLEIRSYPPEAVASVEIYPEEVAVRHGYRADQKVVNIQLQPRFRATTIKGGAQSSAENGGEALNLNADYLRLRFDQRLSFDLRAGTQNEILESDRSVPLQLQGTPFSLAGNLRSPSGGEIDAALSALAGTTVTATTLPDNAGTTPLTLDSLLPLANNPTRTDPQAYRSLRPERKTFSSGASYSHPIGDRLLGTLSGSYEQADDTSYLGLPGYTYVIARHNAFSPFDNAVQLNRFNLFNGPLQRDQTSDIYKLNGNLAATQNGWTWSWVTNLTLTERTTKTDRNLSVDTLPPQTNPFGDLSESLLLNTDRQDSEIRDYSTSFLANGTLVDLPQGPITAALTAAFVRNEQRNRIDSNTAETASRLERDLAQVLATIELPVLKSESAGELSANMNTELSHYSDFDQITAFGVGLNWRLNRKLRLRFLYSNEEGAPGISELGDPLLLTANQSVYDFVNDESIRATRISGGNPELKPDQREIWQLGARIQPLSNHDLRLNIDWIDRQTDQPIDRFPSPSQEIEEAFGERFVRDDAGNLLEFDTRPINLHAERSNELRSGLRYTRPVIADTASASTGKGSAGKKRAGNRRGSGKGRVLVALNHFWRLSDELVIAPGLEPIDYVGRHTAGRQQGGAEHSVHARVSYYYKGLGFHVNAMWQDAFTSVPNADGSTDLNQSDLYTVNIAAFYLFTPKSPPVKRFKSLSGLQVRLNIDNVFNEKPRVRDQSGAVPAGRSGDELDPFGRTVNLSLRKMFH